MSVTTYSFKEIYVVEAEAWWVFSCQPIATGKGGRQRTAKRDKVSRTTERFFDAINSGNPPKTKAEAVAMLTPLIGFVLSFFFRQFIVTVIEWLWDRTQPKAQN